MNIYERKLKLHLLYSVRSFPEWNLCEELLGNFGKIKENTNVDNIYYYNSKNGDFYLSYSKIWSFFERKFNMKYDDIQELTTLYIVNRYNLKDIYPSYNIRYNGKLNCK